MTCKSEDTKKATQLRHTTRKELKTIFMQLVTVSDILSWQLAGWCFSPLLRVAHVPVADHAQTTFVDTLCQDSGLRREELRTAMEDQRVWRVIIRCSASTEWMNECNWSTNANFGVI